MATPRRKGEEKEAADKETDEEEEEEEEEKGIKDKKENKEKDGDEKDDEVALENLSNAELRTRKDDAAAKQELAKRHAQNAERRPCHLFTYRSSRLRSRGKKRLNDGDDDEDDDEGHRHVPKMAALRSAYPDLVAQLKRGDLLEDVEATGYRSDGACAFDGRKCIPLDYAVDDYGGPPSEFAMITEFPPAFFQTENIVTVSDGRDSSGFYWHADEPALYLGTEIVEAAREAPVRHVGPGDDFGVVVEWEQEWYLIFLNGGRNERVTSVVFPASYRANAFADKHGILHEHIFGTEF